MKQTTTDELRIQRGLLTGFLILSSIAFAHFGLTRGIPLVGLMIPGIAIACFLVSRPAALLTVTLFINLAMLKIPGLPNSLSLTVVCMAMMVGWAFLDRAVKHQKHPFSVSPKTDWWLALFALNLLFIMAVRGTGFARLGGAVYGGAKYIALLVGLLFYFAAIRIRLSSREVKIILWAVFIGALIPMVAEVLAFYGRGSWFTQSIINLSEAKQGLELDTEKVAQRWVTFRGVAFALLPVSYLLCRNKIPRGILLILAVLLIGLTGYRSEMTKLILMVLIASVYFSKTRVKTFIFWAVIGLVGYAILIVASPFMPRVIQRSVSFLPFISVDLDVVTGTLSSNAYRFDMWRDYCLPSVPKYLLIGRGIAHDITGFSWLVSAWYSSGEFLYYMGSYHSGPFSLLLDLGLAGTVSFSFFFLLTIRDGWKTMHQYAAHQTSLAARYYCYLTLLMTYEIIAFYLVFGDVKTQLVEFLFIAVQMRILKKNFLMESPPEADFSGGASQASGVSLAPQELTRNTLSHANRWARPVATR